MEFRFNAEEWATLSKEQRAKRCRLMAAEALKLAETTTGTMKLTYEKLGHDWETLAFEVEQNSD